MLEQRIENFLSLYKNEKFLNSKHARHEIISAVHGLCGGIVHAEEKKYTKDHILRALAECRAILAKSPFLQRLQTWPRGYPGDFQTIEYICKAKNHAPKDTFEYYLEDYALGSQIVQQHRNKIQIQSGYILECALSKPSPRILIIGCGSGRDIRNIQNLLEHLDCEFTFNDIDKEALAFTRNKLPKKISENSSFINENILKFVRNSIHQHLKFDLILCGGVFDYLTDREIKFLLTNIYLKMMLPNSKLVFTNIAINNPFRIWIEYLTDWHLKERSKKACVDICTSSGINPKNVSVFSDDTRLTNIVEITC